VRVDRETLTLGYVGAYSSFLRHAEAATAVQRPANGSSSKFVDGSWSASRRNLIVDIALELAK